VNNDEQRRRRRHLARLLNGNRPILVTPEVAADYLPASEREIRAAVERAGLAPWGSDGAGRPVWRLRELEVILGVEPPERNWGWGSTIGGTRGERRRRAREPEPMEDLAAGELPAWSGEEALG